METRLPVLKAAPHKLFALLRCVYEEPFDRDGLRDAVLALYPGRDEKSVFRGMVIPTLRRLGLIIGFEHSIRLSANGMLIVIANEKSADEGFRALRAILAEIDLTQGHFLKTLEENGPISRKDFEEIVVARLNAPNRKQALERIRDWLSYLAYSCLIQFQDYYLRIVRDSVVQTREDLDHSSKRGLFGRLLFEEYKRMVRSRPDIRSVAIEEVRKQLAVSAYSSDALIITERQFDTLLRGLPHLTEDYAINFGRSMGPEEKLFVLGDKYYETISIRFGEE